MIPLAEERRTDTEFQETTQRLTQAELDARRASRRASQQRRRRNSVFQYIAILFMAAFILLLYTFMMERRQSQQQINDLKQSASTVQTLQGLMDENASLKTEVNDLNNRIEYLKSQAAQAAEEQSALDSQLKEREKTTQAMVWFWQLNDAYVRGRFNQCRTLIASMEEAGVIDFLPKENTGSQDFLSPADRYAEIHGRVIK